MVALSGTLLVVHQVCAAEHSILFPPEVTLAFIQNELLMSFSTMPSLIGFWYFVSILWTGGLIPFLIYKKRNVMRYRTGTMFNQKHAYWYGFSPNANSPICPCTDGALHILSSCRPTKMRIIIIKRHNMESVLIVQALQ
jgi:hypothetical protein